MCRFPRINFTSVEQPAIFSMPAPESEVDRLSVRPLREEDLNKVRIWRNSDHVRKEMIFQEIISHTDQLEWWARTREAEEEHFIYSCDGEDVGLLSMKPRDEERTFEAGIFCGEERFLGHFVNFSALIWLYDYAFLAREMLTAYGQVRAENQRALRINTFLGFAKHSEETSGIFLLKLEKARYIKRMEKFRGNSAVSPRPD